MMASVPEGDPLADDFTHPIRQVDVIDVVVNIRGGGSRYGLTIASPLAGDERSRQRLLRKIEAYIGDFLSVESIARNGRPTPDKCKILVGIHPASDAAIFSMLDECRPWLLDNGIDLAVTTEIGAVTVQ
jgi:hypothetical protein